MLSSIFLYCFVSLVKFSYWSNFHVDIITGSRTTTIFFYKGLTRNPEIRNTPVWVLCNIWGLRQVRNIKFDTNVSNEMLLNAAKCQGYRFYHFWIIKGKPRMGVGGKITPHPPRIGLTGLRWCLLLPIKQICLKTSVRAQILMAQVSLELLFVLRLI